MLCRDEMMEVNIGGGVGGWTEAFSAAAFPHQHKLSIPSL